MLRKLAGQTAVYGISTIAVQFLSFLLTPYLTRIMTSEVYGVVVHLYSIIPFILVLLIMGLETGYFKFTGAANSPQEKKNIFQTTWGAVTVLSSVFFTLIAVFYRQIAEAMDYAGNPSYILFVGGIIALDAITALPFAKLREEGKVREFVIVRLVTVIITVLLCVFFYSVMPCVGILSKFADPSNLPVYYLIANLAASFGALVMLRKAYSGCAPKIDPRLFRTIFLYSLPLLISGAAGMANDFIDRQLIKYMIPGEQGMSGLGIYGAVIKIPMIMVLFVRMYRYAAEPFFLSNFKKDDFIRVNAEAMKYFCIVSISIFLVIALFPEIFALIIGRDFREGIYLLPVLLLANLLNGIMLNLSFWYKQTARTQFAIIITGAGLVVTVVLNLFLIPRMGYAGAAWARLVCEAVMVAVSYLLIRWFYPIPYDLKRIGGYFALGAVIYGLSLLVLDANIILRFGMNLALIAVFAAYAIKREKIDVKSLIKSIVKR